MYELQVEGMSCGHCVATVTKSLQAIDHDARVEVDLSNKKVCVETEVGLDAVKSAITQAGYSVTASDIV